MKLNFLKSIICIVLLQTSCYKTYTCQCSYNSSTGNAGPYTTGQVKAVSKNKALKRCSSTCTGGDVSVK